MGFWFGLGFVQLELGGILDDITAFHVRAALAICYFAFTFSDCIESICQGILGNFLTLVRVPP